MLMSTANKLAQSGASPNRPINQNVNDELKRVAYFSLDEQSKINKLEEQIDDSLITHLILAFVNVNPNTGSLVIAHPSHKHYLEQVPLIKRKNPTIKVLISINNHPLTNSNDHLYNHHYQHLNQQQAQPQQQQHQHQHQHQHQQQAQQRLTNDVNGIIHEPNMGAFERLAQSTALRQKFARSAMEFLDHYSLDGIDIDWEFPNFPNHFGNRHREYERTGLTKILMEIRAAIVENFCTRQVAEQQKQLISPNKNQRNFKIANNSSNDHNKDSGQLNVEAHLLTLAIGAQDTILKSSYELKNLTHLCDWFNVMSYDYYLFKAYAPFTGPNSPLRPIVEPYVPVLGKLSFLSTIIRLLQVDQIEPDRIVMGIPTYARAYRLLFKQTQPAPFTLAYASKPGATCNDYLTYWEVCDMLERQDTVSCFDDRARVPYLLTDDGYTWVSYENEQSVTEKVKTILEYKLAGYMTWNLNSDFIESSDKLEKQDLGITISPTKSLPSFPLHRAMYKASRGIVLKP